MAWSSVVLVGLKRHWCKYVTRSLTLEMEYALHDVCIFSEVGCVSIIYMSLGVVRRAGLCFGVIGSTHSPVVGSLSPTKTNYFL